MKKLTGFLAIAVLSAGIGAGAVQFFSQGQIDDLERKLDQVADRSRVSQTNFTAPTNTSTGASITDVPNFVAPSALAKPAVVHVKTYIDAKGSDPFGGFFGGGPMGQGQASGSGVIISQDGYIATNHHVVRKADKIEVVLDDKRSYTAELVGLDPTTDLALLKIQEDGLSFLKFGNSNDVVTGEWVLAVGNPFNLTSTVTAGIVSAKGRSLNLLDDEFAIESFIQTDAAVNPGNSGGALINTKGELVGINTAIASETGSFAGYSFAVPVNIVRKVMEDLREFGDVQRGIIGVQINNINAQFADKYDLTTLEGAYVSGTIAGGAAEVSGIKRGDVIVQIDEAPIQSASELQEVIGTYRPGDKVKVGIIRDGKEMAVDVVLRNRSGNTELGARREDKAPEPVASTDDLFQLEKLSAREKYEYDLQYGVRVVRLDDGKLKEAGIEEGFIITRVNKEFVDSPEEVQKMLKDSEGSILIEGITDAGQRKFFAFEY